MLAALSQKRAKETVSFVVSQVTSRKTAGPSWPPTVVEGPTDLEAARETSLATTKAEIKAATTTTTSTATLTEVTRTIEETGEEFAEGAAEQTGGAGHK